MSDREQEKLNRESYEALSPGDQQFLVDLLTTPIDLPDIEAPPQK